MQFIEYHQCTTCRKAKRFLDERGAAYEDRNIKERNPDGEELRSLWQRSGLPLKKLFNTSGGAYRALGGKAAVDAMSEEQQLAQLAADGMLVKRPILIGDDFVLVGFKEADWAAVLDGEKTI